MKGRVVINLISKFYVLVYEMSNRSNNFLNKRETVGRPNRSNFILIDSSAEQNK